MTVGSSALDGLRFLDSRQVGDVWALAQLWKQLRLDDLALVWRGSKTEVDVLGCLRAMVWNRLSDAQSKLGVLRWLDTVALPAEFALQDKLQHQHLLRAMDVLEAHSEMAGDVRAHGMSQSGLVERQFMLSLVQTADGLPIAHEVHAGNTAEAKTLLPMIRGLLARYPLKRVVLIADRGLLSLPTCRNSTRCTRRCARKAAMSRCNTSWPYLLRAMASSPRICANSPRARTRAQPWSAEFPWNDQRLVVAHDSEVADRRRRQREETLAELVALGQQWSARSTPRMPASASVGDRCRTRARRRGSITRSKKPIWPMS